MTVEAAEVDAIWSDLSANWRILESNFKAYPVCRWAHPPVEAILSVLRDHDIPRDEITKITVPTFYEATKLATRRPEDSDAAQYSLPLAVALVMRFGTIQPDHLLPDHYDQPEIWRLVDMVSLEEDDKCNSAFPAERYARVTLTLKDGSQLGSDFKAARGNHDAPLTDQELIEKLEHFAGPVLDAEARKSISRILSNPSEATSPSDLMKLLQRSQSGKLGD